MRKSPWSKVLSLETMTRSVQLRPSLESTHFSWSLTAPTFPAVEEMTIRTSNPKASMP